MVGRGPGRDDGMMADHVFHRSTRARLPVAVAGEGITLIDADGRRYLDACGGAAVSALGHGHPVIAAAIAQQARTLEYAHTGFFTSEPAEALASVIAEQCPGTLDRVWFTSSGSEAVEAAIKLARQYHLERGEPQRTRLIARRQSYHGNTLGALSAGGHGARRTAYAPLLLDVSLIDPCFAYHQARAPHTPPPLAAPPAAALETELQRVGPDTVMAFLAETVVGATAGAVPPEPGYLAAIRAICDRHGVLLILDEVMCGSGRTGSFLACEQDGVVPDIATIAKGLGAGYQPIGAVISSIAIHDTIAAHSGTLLHGQTYNGHPVGCAAALAVQAVIRDEGLLAKVTTGGAYLRARLHERLGDHPHVGDIRGRGYLQGIEFVADRAARSPFDPARGINQAIKAEAFARGLLVYPGGGTIDGRRGDHVVLAPPYITSHAELDQIVNRLGEAVEAVFAQVGAMA
jgi:adenosylmethionine-8-amino-7-oxononanoate aminotransferase